MATKAKPKPRVAKGRTHDQELYIKTYLNKGGHHTVASVNVDMAKGTKYDPFGHCSVRISDCGNEICLALGGYASKKAGVDGIDNSIYKIDTLYKAIKKVRAEMKRRTGLFKRPVSQLKKKIAKRKKAAKKKARRRRTS